MGWNVNLSPNDFSPDIFLWSCVPLDDVSLEKSVPLLRIISCAPLSLLPYSQLILSLFCRYLLPFHVNVIILLLKGTLVVLIWASSFFLPVRVPLLHSWALADYLGIGASGLSNDDGSENNELKWRLAESVRKRNNIRTAILQSSFSIVFLFLCFTA